MRVLHSYNKQAPLDFSPPITWATEVKLSCYYSAVCMSAHVHVCILVGLQSTRTKFKMHVNCIVKNLDTAPRDYASPL